MLKFKDAIKTQSLSNFPVRIVVVHGTEPMQIGRDPLCDVRLDHGRVDLCHAVLFYEEGRYWLRNLSGEPLCIEEPSGEDDSAGEGTLLQPQQELALDQPVRFLLGNVVLHLMVPVLQPTREQVRCNGCGRSQDSTRSDCLWCGSSLAFSW